MEIRWFRRSDDGRVAALELLAAAVADANRGRSLFDTAKALVPLIHADPDTVFHVLSAVRPRIWLRLDVELRSLRHFYRPHDEWKQITGAADVNPLALLLCACSGDGRQRQRAVQMSLMRSDQRLLPVLVIRTADLVRQVRDDARQALPSALDAADADGLLRAVGVATAMRDWQRGEAAIVAVTAALRTRSDGALHAARMSADLHVRRLAYSLWLESDDTDQDAVVEAALREGDIICQRLCVEAVVRVAVRDRQRGPLDRLLAAHFARVRVEALAGLVQIGHAEVGEAFLADRSAMLRATAQWAMRRAGKDAADRYRAMLASGDDSLALAAVAGLGECGTSDDADRLTDFLAHDRPRVRAEAVRAVRRLGGALVPVAGMLTDPAPVVVRAAADAVLNKPGLVPVDRLWDLLVADQPAHVRRAALRLLIARDTWTRLEADLRVAGDSDDTLRAYGNTNLSGWLDREAATTYQMPPASIRDRLVSLVDSATPDIGASKARLLRWHLGDFD